MTSSTAGDRGSAGTDPRRILAMGGGGFTMKERSSALDRLVLELTGKSVPKIAGSTSFQLCLAPASNSPISSRLRSRTDALWKNRPLNCLTSVSAMVA